MTAPDISSTAPVVRRRAGFYGLLLANIFSLSGTRLSMIALPWFVITTTGSALQTGLIAAAQMTPYVIAKAACGPLVDRLGPRKVVTIAEFASCLVVATIPLLHLLDVLSIWTLAMIVVVLGAVTGPADGGKGALVPTVADEAQVPLERVTGLYGTIERLASTVGAAAAGAVVALMGPAPTLWITAATFLVAAIIIGVTAPRQDPLPDEEPYLTQLASGLSFIRRDRLLRSLYAMVAGTNLLDAAATAVLLPAWALHAGYGPEVIGLTAAVMAGTAIITSIVASAIGHRAPRRMTYLVGFILAGLPRFAILVVDAPLWAIVAVFAVSGLGAGFINPILGAVIYERIPKPMVGRVSTMGSALAWSGMPLGGIVGGGLIAAIGLSPAILVCGIAYFAMTTLPGLQKEWAEMDNRTPAPQRGGGS